MFVLGGHRDQSLQVCSDEALQQAVPGHQGGPGGGGRDPGRRKGWISWNHILCGICGNAPFIKPYRDQVHLITGFR